MSTREASPASNADGAWRAFFREVFTHSSNAISLLDERRRHLDVNDAATKLTGYRRERLLAMRIDDLLPPEERTTLDQEWLRLARAGHVSGEREMVRADGRRVPVQYSARTELVTGRRLTLLVVIEVRAGARPGGEAGDTPPGPLSPREREVVRLVALGKTSPQIGADLFISEGTVRTHIRNAMEKTDTRTRAQLVAITLANGLLDD
jgi:PAS domain S-box-containing protein